VIVNIKNLASTSLIMSSSQDPSENSAESASIVIGPGIKNHELFILYYVYVNNFCNIRKLNTIPCIFVLGNHARAWNDPPMFSVSVNTAGKPVPTKLNRRVAFPLQPTGQPPAMQSSGSMSLPPMPGPGLNFPPSQPPTALNTQAYDAPPFMSVGTHQPAEAGAPAFNSGAEFDSGPQSST